MAGCVGITEAVMLVTEGRIGPALDSRVGKALRLRGMAAVPTWSVALGGFAVNVRMFRTRHQVSLYDLVDECRRPVAAGRVCDMIAGPRRAEA